MNKEVAKELGVDSAKLAKLEDMFEAGWLHNVLSRITPLTLRSKSDYLAVADIFVISQEEAENVLDRFDADIELFCNIADIHVTQHMTKKNISEELRSHIELYEDISNVFYKKFEMEKRDPIKNLVESPIIDDISNAFVKEFIDKRFNR